MGFLLKFVSNQNTGLFGYNENLTIKRDKVCSGKVSPSMDLLMTSLSL